MLAWYSGVLYCGTGNDPLSPTPLDPDESGFSISNDSGLHWVQAAKYFHDLHEHQPCRISLEKRR